jgi:hypothetical protein
MFQVDSTGNLVRANGAFVRISGRDEVQQHIRVRLNLIRGEVPFNLLLGMNLVGTILAKGTPTSEVHGEFDRVIRGTPGVVSVEFLQSTLDANRHLDVTFGATASLDDLAARGPIHDTVTLQV